MIENATEKVGANNQVRHFHNYGDSCYQDLFWVLIDMAVFTFDVLTVELGGT